MQYPHVLVVGSQNVKEEDRFLVRSDIRPVQLLRDGQFHPIPYFDEIGEFGVCAITWDPNKPYVLYYSTGDNFVRLDLKDRIPNEIEIEGLGGVHEVDYIDGLIYIANTRFDEIIVFNPLNDRVSKRITLADLTIKEFELRRKATEGKVVDKYHCNQIFKGFDENIYFLAHHVTGRQFFQKIAGALLKNQGSGGVFNLNDSIAHNLSLKAPHSVTKVKGMEYWVFNSAYSTIQIHNKSWKQIDELEMSGFGRGACLSPNNSLLFAGVSPPRKRYIEFFKNQKRTFSTKVDVFSTDEKNCIETINISNMEQVSNLYLLSEDQVEHLLML